MKKKGIKTVKATTSNKKMKTRKNKFMKVGFKKKSLIVTQTGCPTVKGH